MPQGEIDQHVHLRRRAHRSNSVIYAYPSSKPSIRIIDAIMYVVGVVGPLVSIPQLVEIYGAHNAQGISAFTWIGYACLSSLWLLYGIVHREKPIILTQSFWLLINSAIAVGAILY